MNLKEQNSEVARLRQQIEEEYEAMMRGLSSFAAGSAKHDFLQARMRRADSIHSQLAQHVGEQEATHTVCEIYNKIMS